MYMCVHMLQDVPAEEVAGELEAPKTSPVFSPKSVENSESPMVWINYQTNRGKCIVPSPTVCTTGDQQFTLYSLP